MNYKYVLHEGYSNKEKVNMEKRTFKEYLPCVKNPIKNFPLFHLLFATFC